MTRGSEKVGVRSEELGVNKWFLRSNHFVILSLSKDLGNAAKKNGQPLSSCDANLLRLRTPCFAQNDKFRELLTPNS